MNLNELIAVHKSGRSYEELARNCGGGITSQRLQQIATTVPKAFPSADTIRGLARGLRVSESVVVLAVAESLGLDVARAVPRLVELLPASATALSDRQAAAIAEVIRSFTDEKAGGAHGKRSAPIAGPDVVVTQPDGTLLVVELKTTSGAGTGKTEAVAQQLQQLQQYLEDQLPDGYTTSQLDAGALPDVRRITQDELLERVGAEQAASTVTELSERRPNVPEKRVARRRPTKK